MQLGGGGSQPGGSSTPTTTTMQTWLHKADSTYSRARPKNVSSKNVYDLANNEFGTKSVWISVCFPVGMSFMFLFRPPTKRSPAVGGSVCAEEETTVSDQNYRSQPVFNWKCCTLSVLWWKPWWISWLSRSNDFHFKSKQNPKKKRKVCFNCRDEGFLSQFTKPQYLPRQGPWDRIFTGNVTEDGPSRKPLFRLLPELCGGSLVGITTKVAVRSWRKKTSCSCTDFCRPYISPFVTFCRLEVHKMLEKLDACLWSTKSNTLPPQVRKRKNNFSCHTWLWSQLSFKTVFFCFCRFEVLQSLRRMTQI